MQTSDQLRCLVHLPCTALSTSGAAEQVSRDLPEFVLLDVTLNASYADEIYPHQTLRGECAILLPWKRETLLFLSCITQLWRH